MKVVPVYNRVRLSRAILPSPPKLAQPAGHPHHCLAAGHHCDVEDGNCDIYESWNSQFILVCRGLIVDCGLKKHLILVKSLLSHIIITWSGWKGEESPGGRVCFESWWHNQPTNSLVLRVAGQRNTWVLLILLSSLLLLLLFEASYSFYTVFLPLSGLSL